MNLDQLERAARRATQGQPGDLEPWYVLDGRRVSVTEPCEPVEQCGYTSNCVALAYGPNDVCNAAFIAAANPATVLALVAVVRAAQEYMQAVDECRSLMDAGLKTNEEGSAWQSSVTRSNLGEVALRAAIEALEKPGASAIRAGDGKALE